MGRHMSQVDAIYRHGVFQPLEPVEIPEDQRVRLSIEATNVQSPREWLEQLRGLHAAIVARNGMLPDSTGDIASDRLR
jgi:predicted DNA-binding antitoxin AbrB/MazE fold protein